VVGQESDPSPGDSPTRDVEAPLPERFRPAPPLAHGDGNEEHSRSMVTPVRYLAGSRTLSDPVTNVNTGTG